MLGSAWGALCYQRGLLPLHASAVVVDGRVHAFTGPSGAGKSTLAAGLSARGLQYFTDDILIIDPARMLNREAACFAGQKSMKLWADAISLVTADKLGPVRDDLAFEKYFAAPPHGSGETNGTLTNLFVLDSTVPRDGAVEFRINPLTGANSIKQLRQSVYRLHFATAIWGRQKLYAVLAHLIAAVRIQSFDRPMDKRHFEAGLDVMLRHLAQDAVHG
jgi:hypothetical protein